MSENLDLVRSIYADWERGDFSSVEWAHPEIEWVIADGPAPGTWTGLAGSWHEFLSAWHKLRLEAQDYREIDHERVLVVALGGAGGKISTLVFGQMQAKLANLFHVRGGKVTRLVVYFDLDRALADLGLEA
jgi:ketosteroid isomerase-like protein